MLNQSELDSLLYMLEKVGHTYDYRTVKRAVVARIIEGLQVGQVIYKIDHQTFEIRQTSFVGFHEWWGGEFTRTTAVMANEHLRRTFTDEYLIRDLMLDKYDRSKSFICLKETERVLKSLKRRKLKALEEELNPKPAQVPEEIGGSEP